MLIAIGIWITVPMGMQYVAGAIVIATFIHYIMNMMICSGLVGLSIGDIAGALIPATAIGFITGIISWMISLLSGYLHFNAFISLTAAVLSIAVLLLAVIRFFPSILGGNDVNPLKYLPEKLKKNKYMAGILNHDK
jgi:hypothetical protein